LPKNNVFPYSLTFVSKKPFESGWRKIVGGWIDIDKKRRRADTSNASSCGKKCVRRRDYCIAASNSKAHQDGQ
jgi:hypothetical protein